MPQFSTIIYKLTYKLLWQVIGLFTNIFKIVQQFKMLHKKALEETREKYSAREKLIIFLQMFSDKIGEGGAYDTTFFTTTPLV